MNAIYTAVMKTVCLRARSFISFEDAFAIAKSNLSKRFQDIQSCTVTDEICETDENGVISYFVDLKLTYFS